MILTIRDETAAGAKTGAVEIPNVPDVITLRELIRLRVREEVARYSAQPTDRFQGLVRPVGSEVELNGYRLKERRPISWEQQADAAVEAFSRNGFFVLVGDRQVEDIDLPLSLTEASDVAFVRLVPLVGG